MVSGVGAGRSAWVGTYVGAVVALGVGFGGYVCIDLCLIHVLISRIHAEPIQLQK